MIYFIDSIDIFSKLLQNIVLLFALIFIYAATNIRTGPTKIKQKILIGFVIGGFAILLMLNPWEVEQGVIFDTRSALFAVSGIFFGPLATLIAVVIASTYRILLGGAGVYAGVATILATSTLGLLWFKIRVILPKMNVTIEYYILGLIAHVVTILCFFLIPYPLAFQVIRSTIFFYLVIFPVVTMLLALSLNNQRERLLASELINQQRILLQSSLDSTKTMEIFVIDNHYQYLAFNKFHSDSMKLYYDIDIQKGMNYVACINSIKMQNRVKESIDQALSGVTIKKIIEVEVNKGKYLEEIYTPIIDSKGLITGATIFSEDVTETYLHELSIMHLSYRDHLTNLYNRRYYTEELARLDHTKYCPLSIVIADINGLKIMNDAFGHQMGDQLLIKVADIFIQTFKKESRVTRIGGDEFIILMPNTTKDHAHSQIEMLRNRLENEKVMDMAISVSFGIATKIDNEVIEDIVKAAEDDMYTHKLFEINSHRNETIKTIINTLHEKNPREELHSERVSSICNLIGKTLDMSNDELKLLQLISQLHDIGKIGIDDAILNKPGKLTDKEWESIKKHPEIGYRILSTTPEYSDIAQDILSHHERWDGKGYPRGLAGNEIPLRARIISIADAYDAMISDRPYRKALTHEQAIEEIKVNAGSQFDPALAKLFIEMSKKIEG